MLLLIGGTLAYIFIPWPWWPVVVALLAAVEVFEVTVWLRLRRRRPLSGHETLVGERGVLARPDRVRIRGTSYPARVVDGAGIPAEAGAGERVEVTAVEGMTLLVRLTNQD